MGLASASRGMFVAGQTSDLPDESRSPAERERTAVRPSNDDGAGIEARRRSDADFAHRGIDDLDGRRGLGFRQYQGRRDTNRIPAGAEEE